jgi:hypothetical protein
MNTVCQVLQRPPPLISRFVLVVRRCRRVALFVDQQKLDHLEKEAVLMQLRRVGPAAAMRSKVVDTTSI